MYYASAYVSAPTFLKLEHVSRFLEALLTGSHPWIGQNKNISNIFRDSDSFHRHESDFHKDLHVILIQTNVCND